MPPRQVWLFKFGCWVALVSAVLQVVGHVMSPPHPVNETERQLLDLASTYRFQMLGGAKRSLMDMLNGFSLTLGILVGAIGAVGLTIQKRASHDGLLMIAVSRAFAMTGLTLVILSFVYFFIVPTMGLALMTFCFAFAAVSKTG